jgi:hypothetical protein
VSHKTLLTKLNMETKDLLTLLELADYKPLENESEFLQITRGIMWVLNSIPGFTPTPVKFGSSVSDKM